MHFSGRASVRGAFYALVLSSFCFAGSCVIRRLRELHPQLKTRCRICSSAERLRMINRKLLRSPPLVCSTTKKMK